MLDITVFNPAVHASVHELVFRAFGDAEGEEEGRQVAALTDRIIDGMAETDSQSYVASDLGAPVAAIFFTPLKFDNPVKTMLLSPVAVTTERQREGIGDRLIRAGLEALTQQGIEVVVTYGDPKYYGRFGFRQVSVDEIVPPYTLAMPNGWQAVPLQREALARFDGRARCIPAFDAPGLW